MRASLTQYAPSPSHAGLWLDRYLPTHDREKAETRSNHVRQVAGIAPSADYSRWLAAWRQTLKDMGAKVRPATVRGRMAVGLGGESVLETSIALHRTYGVPYIPGSALKGLAAAFARHYCGKDWQRGEHAHTVLFGNTDAAGYLTFFDALPEPSDKPLLHPEVMTVHHRDYYGGKEDAPPADWDSPNPVPFLSATGIYLIALRGPDLWVDAAFELLGHALRYLGVGAKTSSGYGRLEAEWVPRLSLVAADVTAAAADAPPPEPSVGHEVEATVTQARNKEVRFDLGLPGWRSGRLANDQLFGSKKKGDYGGEGAPKPLSKGQVIRVRIVDTNVTKETITVRIVEAEHE